MNILPEIKRWAESGLTGSTWPDSERLANMKDALEQIVKLCKANLEDNRILSILKSLAYGETSSDDTGSECLYCHGDTNYTENRIEDINHLPDCPIMLARTILRELGTPLRLYIVTYERIIGKQSPYPVQQTRLGYTEDEIKQQIVPFKYESIQNIRAEYIRDM